MDDILEIAIPETNNLNLDQIRSMIASVSTTEDGTPLEKAMSDLKVALKQNPAACSLLLDEDIGSCVGQLMRMTNKGILDELTNKKVKDPTKKIQVTQEQIDSLTMDDLK